MKKILLILTVLFSTFTFAQTNGITYQAVIYNANGESVPGIKNSNTPLANQEICLQFSILNDLTLTEYQEKITVTTDAYGMVNLVIGNGIQTGGFANSFGAIVWNSTNKFLKIGLNQTGSCDSFEEISYQLLNYVPFSFAATSATSVSGVVGLANGGTNATTVIGAKTNLQLHNVDNTRDLDKPISTLTQLALDSKVDMVAGKNFSTEDYSTTEKTKLASISGTNTGDQDLSSFATTTDLASKVDKVTGKELSTNDFTTVEKTKLAAISGTNTGDQDLSSFATTTDLESKVDKVTGKELSTNDFTTVEKTKLAAISGTNTGDQDLSLFSTNLDLALKANILSPVFSGLPTAPTAALGTNTSQLATTAFVNDATTNKFVDLTTNQSVGGEKIFNSNASFKGNISSLGIVQNLTVMLENSALETGTWGADQWQSFTATASGILTKISIFGNGLIGDRVGILTLYLGTGTSGMQLYSGSTALPPSSGWFDLVINSNIKIVAGQVYSFRIEDQNSVTSPGGMIASINNKYTQGEYYSSVYGANSNYDLNFRLWVGTLTGGSLLANKANFNEEVIASGFKTPTGTSSQYLMADGSVASSTLTNYLPLSGGNMTGKLAIGTSSPQTSAALDITSTTQGFLPPRMTKDQRNAILNKVAGLIVWCKNCGENGELQVYNGLNWTNFIGGITSEPMVVGSNYRGGKIAYIFQMGDPGYVAGEFHGIIASNSDLSNGIRWGQGFDGLTTTYDCTNRHGSSGYALPCAIGSGSPNTTRIISSNTESNPTDYAALICSNYSTVSNGITYDDWFLPSYNEMMKLYENKGLIGGLYYDSTNSSNKSNWYWTSTGDIFQDRAADVNSNDGGKARNFRGYLLSVRAVRYF